MARRGGGPTSSGEVPDLGALRDRPAIPSTGEPITFYANDVQPTLETEGNVTLEFRWNGPDGSTDPVRINVPAGLLVALAGMTPQIAEEAIARYARQAQRLGSYLQRGREAVERAVHHAGPPADLQAHREEGDPDAG